MWGLAVQCDGPGGVAADLHTLWASAEKVQHPVAERHMKSKVIGFLYDLLRNDCV